MTNPPPSDQLRSPQTILVNPKQAWFPWSVVIGIVLVVWQLRGWRDDIDFRLERISLLLEAELEQVNNWRISMNEEFGNFRADHVRRDELLIWQHSVQQMADQYTTANDLPSVVIPSVPSIK